jgi:hypothetical protein
VLGKRWPLSAIHCKYPVVSPKGNAKIPGFREQLRHQFHPIATSFLFRCLVRTFSPPFGSVCSLVCARSGPGHPHSRITLPFGDMENGITPLNQMGTLSSPCRSWQHLVEGTRPAAHALPVLRWINALHDSKKSSFSALLPVMVQCTRLHHESLRHYFV